MGVTAKLKSIVKTLPLNKYEKFRVNEPLVLKLLKMLSASLLNFIINSFITKIIIEKFVEKIFYRAPS